MAIEVVKMGKLPEEKKYRGTCNHCGTVIEAIRDDLEYLRVSYGGEGAWVCPCPLNGCDYRIECEEVQDAP